MPDAVVDVDDKLVETGRRPDVLVTLSDGTRIAFEVQYAELTLVAWKDRHDDYVRAGIHDVWLFGHIPPHLVREGGGSPRPEFRLSGQVGLLRGLGEIVHWIDPEEDLIYTESPDSAVLGKVTFRIELAADRLTSCRIENGRFRTPTDDLVDAAIAQKAARGAAAKAEAEEEQRKQEELARKRKELWDRERQRLIERYGLVPAIIEEPSPDDGLIGAAHPALWRSEFCRVFLEGKIEKSFTYERACALYIERQPRRQWAVYRAITAFLLKLRQEGYVRFSTNSQYGGNGRDLRIANPITVLADLSHPPDHRPLYVPPRQHRETQATTPPQAGAPAPRPGVSGLIAEYHSEIERATASSVAIAAIEAGLDYRPGSYGRPGLRTIVIGIGAQIDLVIALVTRAVTETHIREFLQRCEEHSLPGMVLTIPGHPAWPRLDLPVFVVARVIPGTTGTQVWLGGSLYVETTQFVRVMLVEVDWRVAVKKARFA